MGQEDTMAGQLDPQYRRDYILGGNATVTLVSKRSGDRFTYKIKRAKPRPGSGEPPFFVSLLTGPNNTEDYEFLGTIFADGKYRHGGKSKIAPTAPSAQAWAWTWGNLTSDRVEVWHEGACSRCGRALTDPESIQRGLGPTCAERAAGV
jgi:hypothetical protein